MEIEMNRHDLNTLVAYMRRTAEVLEGSDEAKLLTDAADELER